MMQGRGYSIYAQKWYYYVIAIIGITLFIVAWPGNFFFLNDDFVHIPKSGQGILGQNNSVRHIGDLSLIADYALYQKQPFGYHLTNILIHFFNVVLLGAIMRMILPEPLKRVSAFIMVGFAFYGFHSEAVFWVIGRSASLGFLFLGLAIWSFLKIRISNYYLLLYFVAWGLALFSYESVWVWVPVVLFVLFFQPKTDSLKFSGKPIVIWGTVFLFVCYLFVRKSFTGSLLGTYEAEAYELLDIQVLFLNYLKLILRTLISPLDAGLVYLFFSIGILFPGIYSFIKKPKYFFGNSIWMALLSCWLFSYLPYLSLGISLSTPESERFLYLPSACFVSFYIYTISIGTNRPSIRFFNLSVSTFLMFHGLWFINSSIQYQKAGAIVKASYTEICNIENCHKITIKNLPETIYGLPTLRSGFTEGIEWLCTKRENGFKVEIESKTSFPNGNIQIQSHPSTSGGECTMEYNADL